LTEVMQLFASLQQSSMRSDPESAVYLLQLWVVTVAVLLVFCSHIVLEVQMDCRCGSQAQASSVLL
jgi:hypothetical protein